jgi:hypothetical protein
MRALYEQVRRVPSVKALAFILFALLLVSSIFPSSVFADDTTNSDPVNQVGPTVESPGIPSATSSASDYTIVWVWTPPAGGLTPDAPAADPSQTDPSVQTGQPSDIIQFGYELSTQGTVIKSDVVDSNVLAVTTPVTQDGEYTFKVWSITRVAATSAPAVGGITITTPVPPTLPPIEGGIVPAPIDTTSVVDKPASSVGSTVNPPLKKSTNSANNSSQSTNASVLSATDIQNPANSAEKVAVVKASSQGWVILGVPWYLWLVTVVVVFITGRGVLSFVYHR